MTDLVRVKPRTGLILAGIPRAGAAIPRELADEWIANRLVVAIPELKPAPVRSKSTPTIRRSPRGSGATRPRKRSSR